MGLNRVAVVAGGCRGFLERARERLILGEDLV